MSTLTWRLLTDEGDRFVAYNTTSGHFLTDALLTPDDVSRKCDVVPFNEKAVDTTVDLRLKTRIRFIGAVEGLKRGNRPTMREVYLLHAVKQFVETIASPHQDKLTAREIDDIQSWIRELGFRKTQPHKSWMSFVMSSESSSPYDEAYWNHKSGLKPVSRRSPEEYELAGRYLEMLATIAGIYTEGAVSMAEVFKRRR